MSFFMRDLFGGRKTMGRDDDDDDSSSSASSSSSVGSSLSRSSMEESESGRSISSGEDFSEDEDCISDEESQDEGANIDDQGARIEYSRNEALAKWTGRCSVPYSEPPLVSGVSSTANNFPTMGDIAKQFQSAADPQFMGNPNSLFCNPLKKDLPNNLHSYSPFKRELPNELKMCTSTPIKRQCLAADQFPLATVGVEPISTTNCYNPSSAHENVSQPTVNQNQPLMMRSSGQVVEGVQELRSLPAFHNAVISEGNPPILGTEIEIESFVKKCFESTEILTQEILLKIFRLVSLDDRKNVRLVCKDWFDVCSAFEAKEKICIPRFYNDHLTQVMFTLHTSQRRCFNFEFHGLDFGRKPRITFWKTCGPRVVSMKLFDCKISSPAFANILRYCYNLQTLEFDFYRLRDVRSGVRLNTSTHTLPDDLSNRSLRTLKIHFKSALLDDPNVYWLDLICQFFRMFPNISDFSFGQNGSSHINEVEHPAPMGSLNGELLFNRYFVRNRLGSIALNMKYHPKFNWESLSLVQGLTRLVEIVVNLNHNIDLESFSKFLRQQVNLRAVTLYSYEEAPEMKLASFVPLILKKRGLREFNLYVGNTVVHWNYEWFILLSSSNMEALRIACLEIDFSSGLVDGGVVFPTNSKLVTLAIKVEKYNPYDINVVPMLNSFLKLEKLRLSYMTDEIMNSLHRAQGQLKVLSVNRTLNGPPSNVTCLLKKLIKLEVPETVAFEGECLYHLKQLRVLRPANLLPEDGEFEPRNYLDLGKLQSYRYFCPFLEVLWIDCIIPSVLCCNAERLLEIIDGLLDSMNELKFLYLAHSFFMVHAYHPKLTEEEVSLIFFKYSSLRVFVYGDIFVRDVIQNRVRKLVGGSPRALELLQKFVKTDDEWDYQYNSSSFTTVRRNTA